MSKYTQAADKAVIDHLNYCRALLNVQDDETLAVAIEELKAREAKLREALAIADTTLAGAADIGVARGIIKQALEP